MINQNNILACEFVGLDACVIQSTNRYLVGISGRVIDETKSTITLDTARGARQVPKGHSRWGFSDGVAGVAVNGSKILYRPSDRTRGRQ